MDSQLASSEALRLVAERLNARAVGDGLYNTQNLQIYTSPSGGSWNDIIEESFGFRPRLDLGFRQLNGYSAESRDRELIQAALALLGTGAGDAVLLQDGELVVLQRLEGNLTLNGDRLQPGSWPAEFLTMRHSTCSIDSPLL